MARGAKGRGFTVKISLPLVLVTFGSVAWLVFSPPPATHSSINQGQAIYEQRCASCHGPQGRGDGPQAPFLSPRPGNLVSAYTSVKSDTELLTIIANGKPHTAMPGWKDRLSEEERKEVLAYIRSLVRFYPPSPTPNPPETP